MSKKIYEKSTRELMREYSKLLKPGERIKRADVRRWFQTNYQKIKQGTIDAHITRMTTNAPSRTYYSAANDGSDDVFFQLPDGTLRLYDGTADVSPIYEKSEREISEINNDDVEDAKEFAYEHDLRDFLARNLEIIEGGLVLYEDEGITGIEYDAGGRYIDILAIDNNGAYVVIELKVSRGYDRVIGQLLRYIGWVKANLAENNQLVRGIIVARSISEDLKIACSQVSGIELFEYKLSVALSKVQ